VHKIRIPALALTLCLILAGCARTGEIEHQAYALVLGVDLKGEQIELTMRIPRIGQAQGNGGEASGDERYLTISARGTDYHEAIERLQWTVERELNLSQVKMIIVSEELAATEKFRGLIRELTETRHLYATAAFVVCESSIRKFIEGQETILGTRLSDEITAELRHYASHGYIPKATFADLYFSTYSLYSDPTGILGFVDPEDEASDSAEAYATLHGSPMEISEASHSASSRHYLGTALFRDGRLVGHLDADETLALNLISGRVESFSFAHGGAAYALSSFTGPRVRVGIDDGEANIDISLRLNAETRIPDGEMEGLERDIAESLEGVIRKCQALLVEPFGFAERAASSFPDYAAWQGFDWRRRFETASVRIAVSIVNLRG